jgi:polyisoprenyl-phosphate glycosyltransferase
MPAQTHHLLKRRDSPHLLSIVVTAYNEEEGIPFLRKRLSSFADTLPCPTEIIVVNDGSSDDTLGSLLTWVELDSRVRILNLARNFGHQAAATAGLDQAAGDAIVLMDADLQDPPEVIAAMLDKYREGYDVVYGRRVSRAGETIFKRASAWAFYRLMRLLIHPDLPSDVGDFRLVSRACLDALLAMRETHRFLRGMVAWVGFAQTDVPFARDIRVAGETKYPLSKMVRFAWTAAVSFSPTPLRISFGLGILVALAGVLEAANAVVRTILGLYVVAGWSSMIVVTCLIGGSILVSIGLLGEYVGRIFEASKDRPLYIIASNLTRTDLPANIPEQLAALSKIHSEQAAHSESLVTRGG